MLRLVLFVIFIAISLFFINFLAKESSLNLTNDITTPISVNNNTVVLNSMLSELYEKNSTRYSIEASESVFEIDTQITTLYTATIIINQNDNNQPQPISAQAKVVVINNRLNLINLDGDVRITTADIDAKSQSAVFNYSDDTLVLTGNAHITSSEITATANTATFNNSQTELVLTDQAQLVTPDLTLQSELLTYNKNLRLATAPEFFTAQWGYSNYEGYALTYNINAGIIDYEQPLIYYVEPQTAPSTAPIVSPQ